MQKPFLLFILLFCFTLKVFCTGSLYFILKGSLKGKITDAKTGKGISGATIYITDIKSGTQSDGEGDFIIQNIPEGNHLIEVSHIGYSSIAVTLLINSDTKKDFVLTESVVENNTVIVTGVTGATQLKKVPFSVAVLRKQDFFQNTSSNIIESLTKLGGVSTIATGPAISKPVIRGLSYNRVLTVNDGVRQEGQQWGDEHGIEIDEASVNKIELLKGPASLIYGSDAMAGVVNIITTVPVPNNSIKANISSNFQSNNKLRTLNANIGGNKNGFNWNLYSSNKIAEDYKNKYDGRVYNSKFNEHNIGGYAGYNDNWGYSHLLISNFNLNAGLVEGERDAAGFFVKPVAGAAPARATDADFKSSTPQIPYQHIRHFKIATDNSIKIKNNRLTFNIGLQQNRREEFGNANNIHERSLYFDLKTFTYSAQFHFTEKNGFKTSIGINGMQQNNTNKGAAQLIPNYKLFDFGTYVYTQKVIKKITVSGGVRFDNRYINVKNLLDGTTVKGTGFNKSFTNLSGSVGLAAQLTEKINIKCNAARGFRAPSIPELASNGAHEGTIRYEYGDAALKSETSLQFDGGFEYTAEHISFGVTAFVNSFKNFIFYRKLSAKAGGDSMLTVNGNLLTAFKFNQQQAFLAGLEATIDIHPHPLDWLHIQNTFSFVNGKFAKALDNSKNIPFIPAPKLVTEFRVDIKKINAVIKNFYAKLEMDNTFTQNHIFSGYNTETRTTGYTLLNAGFGTDFFSKKEKHLFSLSCSAINLANVAYQNHLSRLKYAAENLATGRTGVFNMGRNLSIKLNIPLSFTFNN